MTELTHVPLLFFAAGATTAAASNQSCTNATGGLHGLRVGQRGYGGRVPESSETDLEAAQLPIGGEVQHRVAPLRFPVSAHPFVRSLLFCGNEATVKSVQHSSVLQELHSIPPSLFHC